MEEAEPNGVSATPWVTKPTRSSKRSAWSLASTVSRRIPRARADAAPPSSCPPPRSGRYQRNDNGLRLDPRPPRRRPRRLPRGHRRGAAARADRPRSSPGRGAAGLGSPGPAIRPDVLLASTLPRAIETAQIIAPGWASRSPATTRPVRGPPGRGRRAHVGRVRRATRLVRHGGRTRPCLRTRRRELEQLPRAGARTLDRLRATTRPDRGRGLPRRRHHGVDAHPARHPPPGDRRPAAPTNTGLTEWAYDPGSAAGPAHLQRRLPPDGIGRART
jgi:hypothetical protein